MSEDESAGSVTFQETGFIAHIDDEDALWSVHEITGENKVKYKVKWAGTDPDTGKPWPDSWIPKSDCTDDLVDKWKAKKCRSTVGAARGSIERTKMPQAEAQSRGRQRRGEESVEPEGRSSKKHSDKEKAPRTSSRPPMKVGPPRGVPKKIPAHSRPQPPKSSPGSSLRSARDAGGSMASGSIKIPRPGTEYKRGWQVKEDFSSEDLREEPEEGRLSKKRRYNEEVQRAPNPSSRPPMKVGPPRGVPKNLGADSCFQLPIQPPAVELSPRTRHSLEAFDRSMEESERPASPEASPNITLQGDVTTITPNDAPVGQPKVKETVMAFDDAPNLPELAAQAEELKRLYLAINTATNAALKLLDEVVKALESGRDSQTGKIG